MFVSLLAGVLNLAACGGRENPAAPTTFDLDTSSSAQDPLTALGDRGIRLLKGSEVVLEPVESWSFIRITLTLKGQHGFRVDARGSDTFFPAAQVCGDTGCAPDTPLPLGFFVYDGNANGVARLQGRSFEFGGPMAGSGDIGAVRLNFGGTIHTPSSSAGSATLSVPFTLQGQLLYPSGLPAYAETPLVGTGRAVVSFVWQPFPAAGTEGWALTSVRYVFD
jgi:hypothetical protein